MTLVSVIIPCYNQARYLTEAIESVLAQTHPDVELIVVDDGSTDETRTVCARYAGRPGFHTVSQENRGLPAARNAGILTANGAYLSFLDADDTFLPEKLAAQARVLDENPSVGWVYCDVLPVGEHGTPLDTEGSVGDARERLSGNLFSSLMLGGYFPPHTVLVRRSILDEAGLFDVELGGHADYELWLRLSALGHHAYYVDEKLVRYRRHGANMSGDGEHMLATKRRSLIKTASRHPILCGEALHALQERTRELYEANRWLRDHWEDVLARARDGSWDAQGGESFAFVSRFKQARLVRGNPDQVAIWEADIGGEPAKAIYVQPPAQLEFRLRPGRRGRLSFAVAMHPECWSNPRSGGCQFIVLVNQSLAFMTSLDPTARHGQRRWHRFEMDVPESPSGEHEIVLETRSQGPTDDFRWALFREPRFTWAPESSGAETEETRADVAATEEVLAASE